MTIKSAGRRASCEAADIGSSPSELKRQRGRLKSKALRPGTKKSVSSRTEKLVSGTRKRRSVRKPRKRGPSRERDTMAGAELLGACWLGLLDPAVLWEPQKRDHPFCSIAVPQAAGENWAAVQPLSPPRPFRGSGGNRGGDGDWPERSGGGARAAGRLAGGVLSSAVC